VENANGKTKQNAETYGFELKKERKGVEKVYSSVIFDEINSETVFGRRKKFV